MQCIVPLILDVAIVNLKGCMCDSLRNERSVGSGVGYTREIRWGDVVECMCIGMPNSCVSHGGWRASFKKLPLKVIRVATKQDFY